MANKHGKWSIIGALLAGMLLMSGFNVIAPKNGGAQAEQYNTDKTDRTLIKEIHANQQQVLSLLREIKGMIQTSR